MPKISPRYRFPPGVTSMTTEQFAEHRRAVDARIAAEKAAREARRAEGRKVGPAATLATLAVGASCTFPQYKSTAQLSSSLRAAYVKTGRRFTSAIERKPDMLTGETLIVTGVTVTRIE